MNQGDRTREDDGENKAQVEIGAADMLLTDAFIAKGTPMNVTWQQVVPVVASILTIIVIAAVRVYSKTLAAITATMPVTIPLALWIVYADSNGDQTTVVQFVEALSITVVANLFFVLAMWLAARAGWRLAPLVLAGYFAWSIALALMMGINHLLGR